MMTSFPPRDSIVQCGLAKIDHGKSSWPHSLHTQSGASTAVVRVFGMDDFLLNSKMSKSMRRTEGKYDFGEHRAKE